MAPCFIRRRAPGRKLARRKDLRVRTFPVHHFLPERFRDRIRVVV